MTRKRFDDSSTNVSLFPFLDALSGVIGILALIISTIAALNMKDAKQVIEHPKDAPTTPLYVECREEGVLLHPEKIAVSMEELENSQTAWDERVREVAASRDKHIVLLVRPDGVECFDEVYGPARNAGAKLGYEPVAAEGEIVIEQPQS